MKILQKHPGLSRRPGNPVDNKSSTNPQNIESCAANPQEIEQVEVQLNRV